MEFPLILDLEALAAWFGFWSLVAWVLKILLVPVVKSLDQLTHRWFLATILYHSCEPGLFQRERQVHAAHCKGLAELHLCTLLGEDETFGTSWVFSGHCSQWRCQQWSLLHLRPFATRGYPARRLLSRSFQGNLVQLGFSCRWRQVSVDQVWRRSLAHDTCGVLKLCEWLFEVDEAVQAAWCLNFGDLLRLALRLRRLSRFAVSRLQLKTTTAVRLGMAEVMRVDMDELSFRRMHWPLAKRTRQVGHSESTCSNYFPVQSSAGSVDCELFRATSSTPMWELALRAGQSH